ncbi:Calcium/proton exchanger [Peniophora sp. CONT]|nr:Calcium/proton exchanger [Peniophora sp. CONT]
MASPKTSSAAPADSRDPIREDTLPDPQAPPVYDDDNANGKKKSNKFLQLLRVASTRLRDQAKPEVVIGAPPTLLQQFKSVIFMSWLNLLLVFIPLAWAFHFAKLDNTLIFVFSFIAIIPLAQLLAYSTEELSTRVGQTLAGLINATLGNAVELIVAIIALTKCELQIVQSSLVGSILSNLLLVLGMCFFAGGTKFAEQGFAFSASQINTSLLTLSVIAVLLPAAFHLALHDIPTDSNSTALNTALKNEGTDILAISHGVALILLFIYLCYLVFQLFSHKSLYDETNPDNLHASTAYSPRGPKNSALRARLRHPFHSSEKTNGLATTSSGNEMVGSPRAEEHEMTVPSSPNADAEQGRTAQVEEEEEGEHTPELSVLFTVILLVAVTVLVAITAEFLVDSIDELTNTGAISKEFVGLILLPIVGNAAEHVTAVTVSVKDKLTLSLGVAVGSSIQIALFVIPFIVTLAWILGKPLTLLFDPFESIVLFLAVLTVNYVVQDGKSNWLEGMILMCLYIICAVVFWYYPGSNIADSITSGCDNIPS